MVTLWMKTLISAERPDYILVACAVVQKPVDETVGNDVADVAASPHLASSFRRRRLQLPLDLPPWAPHHQRFSLPLLRGRRILLWLQ